jgi:diguanylate cyclase (GGDEF)-like protein
VQITFQSESVLANLVVRDRLTGLHNRYYMSEYLNGVMSGDTARSFWVAMMDIDNFKRVNDTYGHNCGDYVLKSVAEIIQSNCQGTEFCRWGGEEFLVVGRAEESCACARERLDSLRKRVEEYPFCYDDQPLHITITIGMARYESGKSVKEWINHADQKLYQGKCSGKNRVVC